MNTLLGFLQGHGTKLLAGAQATVALLTTLDVIPTSHLKYWIAASAVLTLWRGFANSATINASAPLPPPIVQPPRVLP